MSKSGKKKKSIFAGTTRHFGGAEFVYSSTHGTRKEARKQGLNLRKQVTKRKLKFRVVETPKRHRKAGSRYDLLIG